MNNISGDAVVYRNQGSSAQAEFNAGASSNDLGYTLADVAFLGAGPAQTARVGAPVTGSNPQGSLGERDDHEISASVEAQRALWRAEQEETHEYDAWLNEVGARAKLDAFEDEQYALMLRVSAFANGFNDEGGF